MPHAMTRSTYDAFGNPIDMQFLGRDGKLILDQITHYGFARMTSFYNANGRPIERRYFGADGKPGTQKYPPVKRWIVNPATGFTVRFENRDENGQLVDGWGPALQVDQVDDYGRVVGTVYRNAAGEPVAGPRGASDIANTWIGSGTLMASSTLTGPGGQWISDVGHTYDRRGTLLSSAWRDAVGNPAKGPDGCAVVEYVDGVEGRTALCDGVANHL